MRWEKQLFENLKENSHYAQNRENGPFVGPKSTLLKFSLDLF